MQKLYGGTAHKNMDMVEIFWNSPNVLRRPLDFKALPVLSREAVCSSWMISITSLNFLTTFVPSTEQSSAMAEIRRRLFGRNCSTSLAVPWI